MGKEQRGIKNEEYAGKAKALACVGLAHFVSCYWPFFSRVSCFVSSGLVLSRRRLFSSVSVRCFFFSRLTFYSTFSSH